MKRTPALHFSIKKLIVAALLVAVIGGGYFTYQSRAASTTGAAGVATRTQVVTVTQGDLSSTLSVVGQLEAEQSASLAFEKMNGTAALLTLDATAGNTVAVGQVLATIDSAGYQQALDQAKSDLQAAEETLADLQAPATELELAQADAALAQAKQTLAQAQSDLADLSDPDLTALENAVKNAQDNITLLGLQTELAERGTLAKNARDLQYSVNWYGRRVEQLKALKNPNAEQTEELAEDQTKLSEAQSDLARVQAQLALAAESRAAELAQAKVTLAEAQQALAEAQAGSDALAKAQAQLAVSQAEVSLQAAQQARTALDEGPDATDLATAQAAVDKKRLTVSSAQVALAGTQLVAPFDGTILETNVSAGDQVAATTTVLALANLKTLQVVASVDETEIRQVSVGQAATITFDAFPGQTFTGQVLSVPLQGTLQGNVMVYSVPISLTGAENLSLLVGMTANVEIQVAQATNALLVPTMALTQSNGAYQVLAPNASDPAGDPEAVPVEVGVSDGTYTVITKGLSAGDQVLVQLSMSSASNSASKMGNSNLLMNASRALGG